MRENNIYPIDIFSVFEYGFEKWQKEFFWPLHHNWFIKLQSDIKNIFVKFINQNNNEIGDMVLIKIKLHYELSNILYAIRIIQELKKYEKKINYSNKSIYFKGLVEKGVPEFAFLESEESQKPNLLRRILIIIARLRDAVLYRIYFFISNDKMPQIAITKYVLNREYISRLPRRVIRVLDGGKIFKGKKIPLSPELLKDIEKIADCFTQEMCAIADKYSIILTPAQTDFMRNLIFRQFKETAEDYAGVKNRLKRIKKFHMFSGPHGLYFTRLLAQAVRRRGGRVTGCSHGYSLYECLRELTCTVEWSTMDEFVVRMGNCIDRIQRSIAEYSIPRNNKIEFISEDSDFFLKLYNEKKKSPLPGSIKEVVIMGFSYNIDFVRSDQLPDLVYLDYERRLIDFLIKHGYKVLYKKHPERALKGDIVRIFSEKAAVIYKRFEDVMDIGDAFLFSAAGSTTWNQAICTNKPIIYINNNWHDIWFPEVYESVKKRCRVVHGGFDERNRFVFNEKELLDALARKVEPPDTEFIEKYMFPEKVKARF